MVGSEQFDKVTQATYGRACMLYSCSVELLYLVWMYHRIADNIGYKAHACAIMVLCTEGYRGQHFLRFQVSLETMSEYLGR